MSKKGTTVLFFIVVSPVAFFRASSISAETLTWITLNSSGVRRRPSKPFEGIFSPYSEEHPGNHGALFPQLSQDREYFWFGDRLDAGLEEVELQEVGGTLSVFSVGVGHHFETDFR